MTALAPHLNAALPGTFRVGPLRVPVYGLFATAGILAALALSQRTARRVGLSADKLWDAGIVAVVLAFFASRILLAAENWQAARAMPLLVLTLPSFNNAGMALTALLTWIYLRRKHLPTLAVTDAWAPCATLLWAALQLGHFFEGTDAGMPTTLPWGVVAPGDTILGRTHPVQLYAMLFALALTFWLLHLLRRPHTPRGRTTACALVAGGLGSFLLGMLRQPQPEFIPGADRLWPLDVSQVVALALILVGLLLFTQRVQASAHLIQQPISKDA